jgi:hypothetical protein
MYDTPIGVGGKIDTKTGNILSGPLAGTIAKNEPAVLSSRAGAEAFNSTVQPVINSANATVTAAAAKKAADAQAAADAAAKAGDPIPQDVIDELNASKTAEQKIKEDRLKAWDTQAKDAKTLYDSLTLASTASAAAQISTLTGSWGERRTLLERTNAANVSNWNQQFLRTGQAEYSPGITGDFITGKEQEGIAKVKALDNEYNTAVAGVNSALEQGNFTRAASLTSTLTGIQDKVSAMLEANAKEATAVNQKIADNLIQTSREMAISDIVAQGITNPAEIQDYLNNTDAGQQVGDITLDEISKVLKVVNPDVKLAGTSSDYQTFKALQAAKDPSVEGLDWLGYKRAVYIATSKAGAGTGNDGGTGAPAQTFEEYLAEKENEMQANIVPGSDLYKQIQADYAAFTPTLVSLANITPTDKKAIDLAGLSGANTEAKAFFIAAPAKFRSYMQMQAAAGKGASTLDELMQEYDAFIAKADTGGGSAGGMTDEEFAAWLAKP